MRYLLQLPTSINMARLLCFVFVAIFITLAYSQNVKRLQPGSRFSGGVIYQNTLYTSGKVAPNPVPDATNQTTQIINELMSLIKEAGGDQSGILTANVYLSDIRYFADMNSAWDAWVDKNNMPTRVTVETRLAGPEYFVEISFVVALPSDGN